jgi:hypothetical protein
MWQKTKNSHAWAPLRERNIGITERREAEEMEPQEGERKEEDLL